MLRRFQIPSTTTFLFSRFNHSVGASSLIPGRDPPQPHIDSIRPHLQELAIRSATAREAIKEAVRAASVEVGLRHFSDFLKMHEFSQSEIIRLAEHEDIDRLRIMLELFKHWYLTTKAPKVVQMNAPWEWFPKARMMRRKFIFHCGPTNSGKTKAALDRLVAAKSGVYCAPLKALASQVWLQVNEIVSCDLLIGDERQFAGSAEHVSCTVEMTPIELAVDVAVIDEIQLIEDKERGWAWTRALLGLPAREIHLCGEPRALSIIKRLLWYTKEAGRLEVRHHNRLVPLDVEKQSLNGRYDLAQSGDCFVCFSRKSVFETAKILREKMENDKSKKGKVHVVYGSLPFAVRQYESDAFNSGVENGDFHVLVSTDAIAYGLNLSVRRIIFSTMRKFDGYSMSQLSPSTILQVGGRAGRFGRKFSDHGYVTTLHPRDFNLLESTMRTGANGLKQVEQAGLLPTADVLAVYAETVPHLPFQEMILKFAESCSVNDTFFVCEMARSLIYIAENISEVVMPSVADKILFCFAPMGSGDGEGIKFLKRLAVEHGQGIQKGVKLLIDQEVEIELMVRLEKLSSELYSVAKDTIITSQKLLEREREIVSSPLSCSDLEFVSLIEKFYKKFNPSKISDVASLCQKYPDRKQLIIGLQNKYNVSSILAAHCDDSDEEKVNILSGMLLQNQRSAKIVLSKSQQTELQDILKRCETLYRWTEVYGWLAWRFPKTFGDLELSARVKSDLVKMIDKLVKLEVHGE